MKVVLCVGWYLPESIGGSELYVHDLAEHLQKLGVDVAIMAPKDGELAERYEHDGVTVVRYPVPLARSSEQTEGELPHQRFDEFCRALDQLRPDVFHLHSNSYGASLHHARYARRIGAKLFTTAHVPGTLCARGTMMRFGREVCDGRIDPRQCVPCWLTSRGLPLPASRLSAAAITRLPAGAVRASRGRLRSVLNAGVRIERARAHLHELAALSERVVCVCQWLIDALLANGIARDKLVLCRQGIREQAAREPRAPAAAPAIGPDAPLRIGYFGRASPIKGVDVLIRALRSLPASVPVTLRIYAIANADEDRRYLAQLRALAAGDPRIRILPALASDAVPAALRECHLVAIPSRWLETGPLVAIEALSAGVPVLGSALGGIAELVEPGVNGWLVPCDDVARWAAQIAVLSMGGADWPSCQGARVTLPSAREVAEQMLALYQHSLR